MNIDYEECFIILPSNKFIIDKIINIIYDIYFYLLSF